jgi:hypothetical protein
MLLFLCLCIHPFSHKKKEKKQSHHRYFTKTELSELFILEDPKRSETQEFLKSKYGDVKQLETYQSSQSRDDDNHVSFLKKSDSIFGLSNHGLLFSENLNLEDYEAAENIKVCNRNKLLKLNLMRELN